MRVSRQRELGVEFANEIQRATAKRVNIYIIFVCFAYHLRRQRETIF